MARRFTLCCVILIILIATSLTYYRALFGTFLLDDYHTIANNAHIAIQELTPKSLKEAALSYGHDIFRRPVSMLSFAVNYYATGLNPFYFKLTNLAIHLMNGIGIFLLTSLLFNIYRKRFQTNLLSSESQWICLAVSATWLLHPFNLTSVLYVVQRMNSLAALFSIYSLAVFVWGRTRLYEGENGLVAIWISLLLFTPLAILSKENGALLPVFMLVIEIAFFNFQAVNPPSRRFMVYFFMITVGIPIAIFAAYTVIHPLWISNTYQTRDFTLTERLMTESRVLWFYIRQILLPNPSQMGVYHDDIAISRGLLQPATTVFSIIGVFALIIGALHIRRKAPIITFGILFFFAGHLIESTVWPLEIAFEHRNYLPMYGLLLILFFYLLYPLKYVDNLRIRQVVAVLLIVIFGFNTYSRANQWSNPFDFAAAEVTHHPTSLRANAEMANIYATLNSSNPQAMEHYYASAKYLYQNMSAIDPNDIHGLVGLIVLNASRNFPPEPIWVSTLRQRLQHAPIIPINIGDKLEGLLTCQINKHCQLTNEELGAILQAPLDNPAVKGGQRAVIYNVMSHYLVNVKQDYPAALAALRNAVNSNPLESYYRLALSSFLGALGQIKDAKEQLAIAKQLDTLHIHTQEIEEQGKLLYSQTK